MLSLNPNKFIKSVGIGIMGAVMLAASALPALAASGYEEGPGTSMLPTKVSGIITDQYGHGVRYASVTVSCAKSGYTISASALSSSVGQYSVSFNSKYCGWGSPVYVKASNCANAICSTGANSGIVNTSYNNLYMTYYAATVNVTVYPHNVWDR